MSRAVSIEFARDVSPDGLEGFLLGLRALLIPAQTWGRPWRAAIELRGDREGVRFEVWIERDQLQPSIAQALRAAFPHSRVQETEVHNYTGGEARAFARLSLGRSDAPLRTDLAQPGLAGLLAPLGALRGPQTAVVQIVLAPAPAAAQARLLQLARRQERRGTRRGLPVALGEVQANRPRARATRDKAATPLFVTGVLIAASDGYVVRDLAAGFGQFAAPYAIARVRPVMLQGRARAQLERRALPLLPRPTLVSSAELASVLAPDPAVLRSGRGPILARRELPVPADAPARGRVLVVAEQGGRERPVALAGDDTYTHLALLGPTGTGKTTVQTNYVLQAIQEGAGAIMIEPKGDAIEELLRRIPARRLDDVIVIDPITDRDHPVGINLLATQRGTTPGAVAAGVLSVLRELNRPNYWGARLDDTAYNGLVTAATTPGATIAELPALYTNPSFRQPYLERVDDPYVHSFWDGFERLSDADQATVTAPVLNRLRPLLRPDLLPIVAQPDSTLDLDAVLRERKILLVRLPTSMQLFGALLVALIWQAIERRNHQHPHRRPDTVLAIDEVATFLRTGADVPDMLATARSLRVSLCLATQHLDQCPPELRNALLANARTRLVFQTGYPDATTLARGLQPHLEAVDLAGLGRYEAAIQLAVHGAVSRLFTARTLPLPEPARDSSDAPRRASRRRYGRPRAQVLAALNDRLGSRRVDGFAEGEVGRRAR